MSLTLSTRTPGHPTSCVRGVRDRRAGGCVGVRACGCGGADLCTDTTHEVENRARDRGEPEN